MNKEAKFSEDRKYRYWLKRQWDNNKPSVNFICLNPSKADEVIDDTMVTKCIRQAEALGFGSIEMTNIFSFVETVGNQLYIIKDPIGKENDNYILKTAKKCDKVIVAWGDNGVQSNRSENVLKLLREFNIKLYCLEISKIGQPRHPGRMKYVEKLSKY